MTSLPIFSILFKVSTEKDKNENTSCIDDEQLKNLLTKETIETLDLFDQTQLLEVINICQQSKSMADAGRKLFNKSRLQRSASNDSQRLRIYLKKFGLEFKAL